MSLAATHMMTVDLEKSNIDVRDMLTRPLETPERVATATPHNVNGYVIPYFDLHGKILPFYRVKLFDHDPKYKQLKETSNHVYYPKDFLTASKKTNYVIITEGEKKAVIATKLGFPTVALGGVDSWRNRNISIPSEAELNQAEGEIKAKLPAGTAVEDDDFGSVARGFQELLDYVIANKRHIIIVFDSDQEVGIKPAVQRAAAALGFELRFRGVPFHQIRQVVLPPSPSENASSGSKSGLDDFLITGKGPDQFRSLIQECLAKRSAFPRHPVIRDYINKRLQRSKLSRKEVQQVSTAVLSDLDANGIRLRSGSESQTYYFDFLTRKLLKAEFDAKEGQYDSTFGQFLYRRYGLSYADSRLNVWLAAQFTGEDPVEDVSPYRVLARAKTTDDSVTYQISDSQYARVDRNGLDILDNGEHGILFESGQVEPLDPEKLLTAFAQQTKGIDIRPYWMDVLNTVRLRDHDKQQTITALLYYMSPWLNRWRGTQLPVEMVLGESGSGKSTLQELRLGIISGQPRLRNAPQDLKDWHASIANSGGLHVTDNVQLVDRNLRQRLSDEICRIITEPSPHIEMRKYYTNADLVRIPINSVFCLTAIQQPFMNADLIQRSIITDLEKLATTDTGDVKEIRYDSEWKANQLNRFGGREGWIAHHMSVLHRFFTLVHSSWDNNYQAKHRLINFEQSMLLMARVFGIDASWIPQYLASVIDKTVADNDWTFEGIQAYVSYMIKYNLDKQHISVQNISDWCTQNEEYQKCENLTNSRRLGKYLNVHKAMVATSLGLVSIGSGGTKSSFKVVRPQNNR